MALTKKKRQALIKWLESMPWWNELPYAHEKQKHLDTANWAKEQQDRADRLEARVKTLEANVSKSVLRRLDAQLEN